MLTRLDISAVKIAALALGLLLVPSRVLAADNAKFEARLRQVMQHCGRPGYVLKPVAHRRLIITAVPYIRQTPLSAAELNCIRREVHKIGWKLAADGPR